MKLFLKILLGFVLLIVLLIVGLWINAKIAARPGPVAEPLASLSPDGLQAAIEGVAAERKLVGMVARVDIGGRTVATAQTGLRRSDDSALLSVDDRFHIGSVGKSMSSTVIATLVEDGLLSWDDTPGERLSAAVNMDPGWSAVTLAELLTHTSGVPNIPITAMINDTDEPVRLRAVRREIAAKILETAPDANAKRGFAYSNAGYMLASIMAEEATGESWETLVKTRLAEPLGLSTIGFGPPTGDYAPWGHRRMAGFGLSMDPAQGADNPPFMAAAGTLHMRLDDLMTYARAHLDAGRSDDALLQPATFERLQTPVMNDYAYGWVVQSKDTEGQPDATQVIWHNGSNTMWYVMLAMLPQHDAVFVLATNDGSEVQQTQRRFDALATQITEAVVARDNRPDAG